MRAYTPTPTERAIWTLHSLRQTCQEHRDYALHGATDLAERQAIRDRWWDLANSCRDVIAHLGRAAAYGDAAVADALGYAEQVRTSVEGAAAEVFGEAA